MYGFQELSELLPEQVLQKVSQQQIFEWILDSSFDFNKRYCSPCREDKKPGCRFEEREDGTIVFVDFGERLLTGRTHRTCFGLVCDYFNVNVGSAIRLVCEKFGLSTNTNDYQLVNRLEYTKKESGSITSMTYEKREARKEDIWWWSQFIIKIEHLTEDNVFCCSKFTVSNHKGVRTITPFKFCYVIDFVDTIKVYQPFRGDYKWITNCHENNIGNFDNLPPTGKELIIQKSYKDHRVLRNLNWGLNVIWTMTEVCVPSIEILKNLTERFQMITIFYDNDEDGRKSAYKLCDIFNMIRTGCCRTVFLPEVPKHKLLFGKYLKDPGEFVQREARSGLMQVLNQIGIYGSNT